MSSGRTEVTLLWQVERYSFIGREKGRALYSPPFSPEGLEGTEWQLWLFPRGSDKAERGFLSIYLLRWGGDAGPWSLSVRCELSILSEDGSTLASREYEKAFKNDDYCEEDNFLSMEESEYRRHFPQDLFTVRCRMERGEGELRRVPPVCFRTTLGVENISFPLEVNNFIDLQPNQKQTVRIASPLQEEGFVTGTLYFTYDSNPRGEMRVDIMPSDEYYFLCKRRIYLLGSEYSVVCSEEDNRWDVERKDISELPLSFTRQKLLSDEAKYLPGGKLSLLCECTFYTESNFEQIEVVGYEVPTAVIEGTNSQEPGKNLCKAVREASTFPSLSDDMKKLYDNKSVTDLELKTKTKTFPSHKSVLCARSPVFHRMLSSDMREKNTASIQMDDLEDDVVHRFLLFLYSDGVQDLEWTMASRLYYAADKYQVERLKAVCSSFLLEHLSPHSAGELLLLADIHGDSELKGVVEEYILEHEEEVFVSREWKLLMEEHPLLAMKAMYLKYERKTGSN